MILDLLLLFFISSTYAGEVPMRIIVMELMAWRRARINNLRNNITNPEIDAAIKNYRAVLRHYE